MIGLRALMTEMKTCGDETVWLSSYSDDDYERAWNECPCGEWLLFLLRKINYEGHVEIVSIAIEIAESVQKYWNEWSACQKHQYMNDVDLKPQQAIDAAKAWIRNPCPEMRRAAADAACVAAYAACVAGKAAYFNRCNAAYFAAFSAAGAARAAHAAGFVSASAPTYFASCSAIDAAYAACGARSARDAFYLAKMKHADIVRKHIPFQVVLDRCRTWEIEVSGFHG